jgi:hypothetical protein
MISSADWVQAYQEFSLDLMTWTGRHQYLDCFLQQPLGDGVCQMTESRPSNVPQV